MQSLTVEQRALLSLTMVSGLGPRLIGSLLQRFGSAEKAMQASAAELAQVPYISDRIAREFRQAMDTLDVDSELKRMEERGVSALFSMDEGFPRGLREIPSPPHLLYVRGTLTEADANAIAIVGSRSCTSYGLRMAEKLASELARAGFTIVSGLARGIDGAAHRGALKAAGRTLAVLAGGLGTIYPPEHKELAEEVQASGALISESNMQMEPLPVLFPQRNRIISGLSRAVVVVEANARSGALITAMHAAEQGREVFAIPGPVDSAASAGPLELLRKGARLVRNGGDILEDLHGVAPLHAAGTAAEAGSVQPAEPPPGLSEDQQRIWEFLDGQPRHQDEIVQQLGIQVATLSGMLLLLEMKKVIRRLPGNRYERC